jgi:hypothetical protein
MDWIAFDRLSPIGDDRADLLFGQVQALIYNLKRTKRMPAKKPKDFMPRYHGEASRQSPEEMQKRLQMFAKLNNIHIAEG